MAGLLVGRIWDLGIGYGVYSKGGKSVDDYGLGVGNDRSR